MTNALENAPAGSPLAGLRERLKAKQGRVTLDLELPGSLEGELALRCRALSYADAEKVRDKYREGDDVRAPVKRSMDLLILACDSFLARDGGRWVPLEDEAGKVRFDARLAEALGIPSGANGQGTPDTHVICRGVFAAASGGLSEPPEGVSQDEHWEQALGHADHLIEQQGLLYGMWLKGGTDVGAEELLGE